MDEHAAGVDRIGIYTRDLESLSFLLSFFPPCRVFPFDWRVVLELKLEPLFRICLSDVSPNLVAPIG